MAISGASVTEGNSGTTSMSFPVTLTGAASAQPITVQYTTANDSATAGSDYTETTGSLTFAPGETTKSVAVPVLGDTTSEPDETFTVTLSNPSNATLGVAEAVGTIKNDDFAVACAPRPLVVSSVAGGGVIASKASAALQTLAEFLQAPVITTAEGKGALSDRHPLALGAMRLRQDPIVDYLAQTDVVLAVGTRLAFPQLFSGQTVVQIDVDASEVGRNYAPTVALVGDAARTLEALYITLAATIPARPGHQFVAHSRQPGGGVGH